VSNVQLIDNFDRFSYLKLVLCIHKA
jgi:hypothetical protein